MKASDCISTDQSGFTLIEILVAVAIFTAGILAVNAMQIASMKGNTKAMVVTESTKWAVDRVETLLGQDFDDPMLADTDGDGTNQDGDNDGVDDDDGVDSGADADNNDIDDDDNFGLDHASAAMADGNATSPDGDYTIFWNIAVNHPFPDIKTIRVIINWQDQGTAKSVTLTYMKSNSV